MARHRGLLDGYPAHPTEMAPDRFRGRVLRHLHPVRRASSIQQIPLAWNFTEADSFRINRFFKTIASFAYNIPVVGPYLAKGLQVAGDKAGANERAHKDLPVW